MLSGKCHKELNIPVIVDIDNQHKVSVDIADKYQTDCSVLYRSYLDSFEIYIFP